MPSNPCRSFPVSCGLHNPGTHESFHPLSDGLPAWNGTQVFWHYRPFSFNNRRPLKPFWSTASTEVISVGKLQVRLVSRWPCPAPPASL